MVDIQFFKKLHFKTIYNTNTKYCAYETDTKPSSIKFYAYKI